MRRFFTNLISLEPKNFSDLVLLVALLTWLSLLVILLIDVKQQNRSLTWKLLWVPILSIPGAGGILYALAQLLDADWRSVLHWRKHDSVKGRSKGNERPFQK